MLALAAGVSASAARADGDPASDVLATQALFLPQDAGLPAAQQTQLSDLLQDAARSGFPIRVALIASPADLGSITGLWRQPQNYAQFLGVELSLVYHGSVLVVMPDGFGLYGFRRPLAHERAALAGARPQSWLGTATLTAVRSLAATAGHPLALPSATPAPTGSTGDDAPWIAFVAGAILVALAWCASLRAHPPQLRRRSARPT